MANAIGNNGGRLYSFAAQPVLIDCNFIVDSTNGNGLGIRSLKGQGVKNVFMNTSATPATHRGYTNPNPAAGYALIQLDGNYNRYLGGFYGFVSPPNTGSALAINASALTVGHPYQIASIGTGPAGSATIAPVADVNGSLASTYFTLYGSYGNVFCIWFYVTGVGGSQPNLGPAAPYGSRGLQYVQQTIAENSSAATIGAALVSTINLLQSGVNGVYSFTATGTTTVTVTSTANLPLAGVPQDGSSSIPANNNQLVSIWFNIASGSASQGSVWTDGAGNLYTVSATISSGTLLKTQGYQLPATPSGVLSFVSGTGSTTSLSYSSAVSGLATGFTFALVNYNTNQNCWNGVGLPAGVAPSVNAAFIATHSGVSTGGGSSGTVYAPSVSGIGSVEVIGDPNQTLSPAPLGGPSAHVGGFIVVQFLAPTSSSVTTPIATAPAQNSTVGMSFYVDFRNSPSNYGTNSTG